MAKSVNKKRQTIWKKITQSRSRVLFAAMSVLAIACVGVAALRQSSAYSTSFVYYSQKDPAWANLNYPYKPGTADQSDIKISRSGCGPTSMAMVASSLSRRIKPNEIAAWYGGRYHTSGGTDRAVYPVFANDFNLNYLPLGYFSDPNGRVNVQNVLKNGRSLVIIHAGPGTFTSTGHIIVLTSYDSKANSYFVADPNNAANNRSFTESDLLRYGNLNTAYGFSSR